MNTKLATVQPCMFLGICGCCRCESPGTYTPIHSQHRCAIHGGANPKAAKEVKV